MSGEGKGHVIVAGAGLGGISAAISLASDGYDVDVFEKNNHVGGKLNVLKREGFSFDLGPSILTLPRYFERLFELHGRRMSDYVTIEEVTPHWRSFFEDGACIDLLPTMEKTCAGNEILTDDDLADLDEFLKYSRRLYDKTVPGYFDRGLDTVWEMVKFYGPVSALFGFDLFRSMDKAVSSKVGNQYLRHILDFFVKYVGSSPHSAPAVLNLMFYAQCKYGLWYVDGGMFELARALEKLAGEVGVRLHLGSEISRLTPQGKRVIAAETADGREVRGDMFVCNMEVVPAYKNLLNESEGFINKLGKFEPACSGLVLHLGINREYPQLAHHNFFFSRAPAKHFDQVFNQQILPEDPTIYVVAPTRTDKTQAPEGCENIKILPHIPYIQDPPFTAEGYNALAERVLDKLERMGLDDIRKHIMVRDMWTPEDIQSRYYSNKGAIYGVISDRKKNHGFKAPKSSPRYENLYFVGGSVNPGGGMPMAVLSGQQVRDRIIGL